MHSYLSERNVTYKTAEGRVGNTKILMGVSQGSVLFLWTVTYDQILKIERMDDIDIICYADDTIILAFLM